MHRLERGEELGLCEGEKGKGKEEERGLGLRLGLMFVKKLGLLRLKLVIVTKNL